MRPPVEPSVSLHSSSPVSARMAAMSPEPKPASTVPPTTAGAGWPNTTVSEALAWYTQACLPVAASSANSFSSMVPKNMRPPDTVGADRPGVPTLVRQRMAPFAASSASDSATPSTT